MKVGAPLAVVVELSHPPRPMQINGPKPLLRVGVKKTVLLPMTTNELPVARLTGMPLIVTAGDPGSNVVPSMTMTDDGANCPGVTVAGASWIVVGLT